MKTQKHEISDSSEAGKFLFELQGLIQKYLGRVTARVMLAIIAQAAGRLASAATQLQETNQANASSIMKQNFEYGRDDGDQKALTAQAQGRLQ